MHVLFFPFSSTHAGGVLGILLQLARKKVDKQGCVAKKKKIDSSKTDFSCLRFRVKGAYC